jgi:hypothetical protein
MLGGHEATFCQQSHRLPDGVACHAVPFR